MQEAPISPTPNVFDYVDYRQFLQAWHDFKKSQKKNFSSRFLARQMGLSSPSFFRMVITGQRNLSLRSLPAFMRALQLTGRAARYFEILVQFNQSESADEQRQLFMELDRLRLRVSMKSLDREQKEYLTNPLFAIVHEMLALPGFTDDPIVLAGRMVKDTSARDVAAALQTLKNLGLIRRENGAWKQCEAVLSTAAEVAEYDVTRFHLRALGYASTALLRVEAGKREYGSVTVAMTPKRFEKIKARLKELAQDVIRDTSRDQLSKDAQIYQLNFQCFPVTRDGKK